MKRTLDYYFPPTRFENPTSTIQLLEDAFISFVFRLIVTSMASSFIRQLMEQSCFDQEIATERLINKAYTQSDLVMFVWIAVLSPILEEIAFRGVLFLKPRDLINRNMELSSLQKKSLDVGLAVLQAGIFGVVGHSYADSKACSLDTIIGASLSALLLAKSAADYGLLLPILSHIFNNSLMAGLVVVAKMKQAPL